MNPPRGRRPGDPADTRAEILTAARSTFGANGFARATIRAIANEAGVDPALVLHHFGSKRELFVTAHTLPIDPSPALEHLTTLPLEQRGRALAQLFVAGFTQPDSGMRSMLRAAATHDDAATMLREFIEASVLPHAEGLAPGPNSQRRVALATSHVVGTLFGREILHLPVLVALADDELVDLLAPVVQHHLSGGAR